MHYEATTQAKMVIGPRMTSHDQARHDRSLNIIRDARLVLDSDLITAQLTEDITYEAQSVLEPLNGINEVRSYLKERFAFFRNIAPFRDIGAMYLGRVDLSKASDHPCLILKTSQGPQSLWVLELSEDDKIRRIDIFTVLPDPREARLINK